MTLKAIDLADVPAIDIVERCLRGLYPDVRISMVKHDFDKATFNIQLVGTSKRYADLEIENNLLTDLRDNPHLPSSKYTKEITGRLDANIRQTVEFFGLIGFTVETLELILLRFIAHEFIHGHPMNKYNIIGRGDRGDLERTMNTTFDQNEKEGLIGHGVNCFVFA